LGFYSVFNPIHRLTQLMKFLFSVLSLLRRLVAAPKSRALLGLSLIVGVFLSVITPVLAFQAQVTPTTAQLGDTIVVSTQTEDSTAPKVNLGSKTYPAFEMAPGRFRTFVPTTPLTKPGTLNIRVAQGADVQTFPIPLKSRTFPIQRIWLSNQNDGPVDEYEFDRMDAFKAIVSDQKFWNGPLLRPNAGPITSGYGIRRYYNGVFAKDYFHRGVDYAGPSGSAIVAPAAGRVALVGRVNQRFKVHGNCIGLDHGQGVSSVFLHLSRIDVKEGDMVQAGQVIGALGTTGASTGPHLHWGLYVNGQAVDPSPWRTKGFS
jgi:murein DD-endopeptidase MepM/ murein hydrolase activator NlpD